MSETKKEKSQVKTATAGSNTLPDPGKKNGVPSYHS